MKKIFITCFVAILMLMLPIVSVAQTQNIESIKKISTVYDDAPKIYITENEKLELDNYVNSHFSEDNIAEARSIISRIVIEPDFEIDTIELANAIVKYVYKPIPEEELTIDISREKLNQLLEEYWGIVDGVFIKNPFSNLIDKIIEIIKARLGWLYQLFNDGITLFNQGISLLTNFIQLPTAIITAFVSLINLILTTPQLLAELLGYLFRLKLAEFMDALTAFLNEFGQELNDLINAVKEFIQGITEIVDYLSSIQDFIGWIMAEPWTDPICVTGSATKNLQPFASATVECRGITSTTDGNGEFSFSVDSTPGDDSLPPNLPYGMHNCQISISEDAEVLQQSPKLLSYVFAGGEISWTFIVIKGRSREINRVPILENLLQRLQNLFPILSMLKLNT